MIVCIQMKVIVVKEEFFLFRRGIGVEKKEEQNGKVEEIEELERSSIRRKRRRLERR